MTGQIIEINKWVLTEACHAIRKMNETMEQPMHIAVNISAVHLVRPDFVTGVKHIIEDADSVSPEW